MQSVEIKNAFPAMLRMIENHVSLMYAVVDAPRVKYAIISKDHVILVNAKVFTMCGV
jgi:hypothetical protein